LSRTKLRHVTNDVSVKDRNRNILLDAFTLNGILKPNPVEVFILYFFNQAICFHCVNF